MKHVGLRRVKTVPIVSGNEGFSCFWAFAVEEDKPSNPIRIRSKSLNWGQAAAKAKVRPE
jgi:hypothetical protein